MDIMCVRVCFCVSWVGEKKKKWGEFQRSDVWLRGLCRTDTETDLGSGDNGNVWVV